MLENDIKKETIKASAAILAASAGEPIPVVLASVLGIAVESLAVMGKKRTKELFDTEELINAVLMKMKNSADFASLVYSIWQKHNLESSAERRKIFKNFLETQTYTSQNIYENSTKIQYLIGNISFRELEVLGIVYSEFFVVSSSKVKVDSRGNASFSYPNLEMLLPLMPEEIRYHHEDVDFVLSCLGSYGLLHVMVGRLAGPHYNQTKLGHDFLSYVKK